MGDMQVEIYSHGVTCRDCDRSALSIQAVKEYNVILSTKKPIQGRLLRIYKLFSSQESTVSTDPS